MAGETVLINGSLNHNQNSNEGSTNSDLDGELDLKAEKKWKPPVGSIALICSTAQAINQLSSLKPVLKENTGLDKNALSNGITDEKDDLEDMKNDTNDSGILEDAEYCSTKEDGSCCSTDVPLAPPLPNSPPTMAPLALHILSSDILSVKLKKSTPTEEDEGFGELPKEGMEAVNEELQKKIQEKRNQPRSPDWLEKYEKKFSKHIPSNVEDNISEGFPKVVLKKTPKKCNKQISEEASKNMDDSSPSESPGPFKVDPINVNRNALRRCNSTPNKATPPTESEEDPCLNPFKRFGLTKTTRREASISEEGIQLDEGLIPLDRSEKDITTEKFTVQKEVNSDSIPMRRSKPTANDNTEEDPCINPFKKFGVTKRLSVRFSNSESESQINSVEGSHPFKPILSKKPAIEVKPEATSESMGTLESSVFIEKTRDSGTPDPKMENDAKLSDTNTKNPPPIPSKPQKPLEDSDTSGQDTYQKTIENPVNNDEYSIDLPPPPSPTHCEMDKYFEMPLPPPPSQEECADNTFLNLLANNTSNEDFETKPADEGVQNLPEDPSTAAQKGCDPPLPPPLPPIPNIHPISATSTKKTEGQTQMDPRSSLLAQIRDRARKPLKQVAVSPNKPTTTNATDRSLADAIRSAMERIREVVGDPSDSENDATDSNSDDDERKWD